MTKDKAKTKEQLKIELAELRQRIADLEQVEIEFKNVKGELRASETHMKSILKAAPVGIGLVKNRVFDWVSERMFGMLGYAEDELLGKSARIIYESDEEFERVGTVKFAEIRERGIGTVETRFKRKDGGTIDVLLCSSAIDRKDLSKGVIFTALDISERKQAEEALREGEGRYRAIVDSQRELVCRFLPDGTLTFVNEAICRLLGQAREEILGQNFYPYIHPDDREKTRKNLASLSKENPVASNEERVILPNGELRWWHWNNQALFGDRGQLVEFQAVGRDVTARKEAEEKLRESEERHRVLLESSPDPVVVYGIEGKATYINPAFEQTFGWSSEELLGGRIDFVPEENWPETREAIARMLRGERIQSFETKRLTKDGRILDIQLSSSLFTGQDGKPAGNIVILRDITQQKSAQEAMRASEEKFRALFDHMPAMAFVIDRDHRLVASNWSFSKKMGDQVISSTLELLGVPQPTKEFWHGVEEQVIKSGQPTWYVEIVNSTRKGRLYIESRKQPIFDQNGSVSMVIGLATDITDYVKSQISLAQEVKELRVQISRETGPTIIGKSKSMSEVLSRVKAIAEPETTVLITGESGSGKELVAEAIHHLSNRAKQTLVKVNCAALPESIIESELFGHVKGAFTGAVSNRIGRFEAAHRGTIFLDEIGDISPGVQVRLLRVLEEKKIERVGDYKPIKVDVRIIAATNQNLTNLVQKGRFREDLYYRLNVFNIHVPPLRERTEDIPLLVAHFLNACSRAMNKEITSVSDEAMKCLLQHNWRGNIRELMNVVESACVLCAGETIRTEHLPPIFESWVPGIDAASETDIREALRLAKGNKAKAARLLGIHRSTLYRRMERDGIAT